MKSSIKPTRIYLSQSEKNLRAPLTLNLLQNIKMIQILGKL